VKDLISPKQWPPNSPDLNPVDYSICNTAGESLPSRIANVNELEMCLIIEWACIDQSIVDAAFVPGAGHTEHQA